MAGLATEDWTGTKTPPDMLSGGDTDRRTRSSEYKPKKRVPILSSIALIGRVDATTECPTDQFIDAEETTSDFPPIGRLLQQKSSPPRQNVLEVFDELARQYRLLEGLSEVRHLAVPFEVEYQQALVRAEQLEHLESELLVRNFTAALPLKPGDAEAALADARYFISKHSKDASLTSDD